MKDQRKNDASDKNRANHHMVSSSSIPSTVEDTSQTWFICNSQQLYKAGIFMSVYKWENSSSERLNHLFKDTQQLKERSQDLNSWTLGTSKPKGQRLLNILPRRHAYKDIGQSKQKQINNKQAKKPHFSVVQVPYNGSDMSRGRWHFIGYQTLGLHK